MSVDPHFGQNFVPRPRALCLTLGFPASSIQRHSSENEIEVMLSTKACCIRSSQNTWFTHGFGYKAGLWQRWQAVSKKACFQNTGIQSLK
jgi:hypothetical protein